jgi:hypothetical protein
MKSKMLLHPVLSALAESLSGEYNSLKSLSAIGSPCGEYHPRKHTVQVDTTGCQKTAEQIALWKEKVNNYQTMNKREYYVEIPLTGYVSGTVIAESEEDAISIFADECCSDHLEWGIDASNGTAVPQGDELEDDETEGDDEETEPTKQP